MVGIEEKEYGERIKREEVLIVESCFEY